jgi:hypothetical protein
MANSSRSSSHVAIHSALWWRLRCTPAGRQLLCLKLNTIPSLKKRTKIIYEKVMMKTAKAFDGLETGHMYTDTSEPVVGYKANNYYGYCPISDSNQLHFYH